MNRRYFIIILLFISNAHLHCMLTKSLSILTAVAQRSQTSARLLATSSCHDRVSAITNTSDMKRRLKVLASFAHLSPTNAVFSQFSPYDVMTGAEKDELHDAYLTAFSKQRKLWNEANAELYRTSPRWGQEKGFRTEYVPRALFAKTTVPPFQLVADDCFFDTHIKLSLPILALFTHAFNRIKFKHEGLIPYVLPEDHTNDDCFAKAVEETVSAISNFGQKLCAVAEYADTYRPEFYLNCMYKLHV